MKLKYDFQIQELMDQYFAVPVGDNSEELGGMIKLNETGKRILELLQEETDLDSVIQALLAEYDAPESVLREEVEKMIAVLHSEDII